MWCDQCLQHFLQLLTRAVWGKLIGEPPTEKLSAFVKADQMCIAQFRVVNPLSAARLRQIHAEYEQIPESNRVLVEDAIRRKMLTSLFGK